MKNLLNPRCLLLLNSLPIFIVLMLFWSEYRMLQSILPPESQSLWLWFAGSLAAIGALNLGYTLFLHSKKATLSISYALTVLLIYTSYLYLYAINYDGIIPFSIPRWMVQDSPLLYLGTFLMPTLAHAVFILVIKMTKEPRPKQALFNFIYSLFIPIGWYVLSQLMFPLWHLLDADYMRHLAIIFFVITTILFLFFCIRGIYILAIKKGAVWQQYRLAWIIPIAILFPLLGLALNQGLLHNAFHFGGSGIFGDFSNTWFYIFAVITGLSLCLPNLENIRYRQGLFLVRSLTFAYTLYFFLVFLPYLPLSIIAILAIGAGFLMLTPLALFVIHLNELYNDYQYLKAASSFKYLSMGTVLSFSVLPILITVTFLNDKLVLNDSLDYLYNPDYSKEEKINKTALKRTLNSLKSHKEGSRDIFISSHSTPFLSAYYNWLVLDNLTLSDAKINQMERVFWGGAAFNSPNRRSADSSIHISQIKTNSRFDEQQGAWVSQLDLEIKNTSTNSMAEYLTQFELPEGTWISDYYLYVGERKEQGLLAEKKSALWIYNQITNSNRDPGILYYLSGSGNQVAFRVFPFAALETRRTGIELIHKEPIQLRLEDSLVYLGDSSAATLSQVVEGTDGKVVYIPAALKETLPTVERKPYYHFLVDVSTGTAALKNDYKARINKLLAKEFINNEPSKISFVNSYVQTIDLKEDWSSALDKTKAEGGFFLDRAIKKALFDSYQSKSLDYPILVVLGSNRSNAIVNPSYEDWSFAFPENFSYYWLDEQIRFNRYDLKRIPSDSQKVYDRPIAAKQVLAYPNAQNPIAYLPDNGQGSIVLKEDQYSFDDKDLSEKDWLAGLSMQGRWISQLIHPETSEKEWLSLVKSSFQTKIMMPVTSYIALENEAQKEILLRKQAQVLNSNKSLDIGENPEQMSEPGLWLLLLALGGFFWYRRKRKIAKKLSSI